MRVITLNYDPLNCTCWALPGDKYCAYCSAVCDTALNNYGGKVGDWATFSFTKIDSVAMELEEAAHQAALAKFFEEGRAPTPPLDAPVYGLWNFLGDLGDEAPWLRKRAGKGAAKGKGKGARSKPYDQVPRAQGLLGFSKCNKK